MKNWKRTGYTALGWATWKVGKRVAKKKARDLRPSGGRMKLAVPLLVVAVTGAIIATRGATAVS